MKRTTPLKRTEFKNRGTGFNHPSPSIRRDAEERPVRGRLRAGKGLTARRPSKAKTVDGDSARKIKDELDQLVREIIKLRDRFCFTCHAPRSEEFPLEVGHLFRRGIEPTRWDLRNNHAQCSLCNQYHESSPGRYEIAYTKRFGLQAFGELMLASMSKHKFSYTELLSIRDGLRRELEARKVA